MTVPDWIAAAVRDFGRGAKVGDLALSALGTASLRFGNGFSLRFEYGEGGLAVSVLVPSADNPGTAARILSYAHPDARYGVAVRAGYLAKPACAVFAVIIAAQDVTLPVLNAAFDVLWRVASEFGGAS